MAALAVSILLVASTGEKPTVYRPVVMVTTDTEPNTPLTVQNLAVKNIPAEAVPAGALASTGRRVACADLDLLTPDLPGGGYGLDQVSEDVLRGDFHAAKTALALPRLKPAGVYLLAGPSHPLRAETMDRVEFVSLVSALSEVYGAVVLDTSRFLSLEATLAALDVADLVVVPVAPVENQVRHLGRYLLLLERDLVLAPAKVRVVVNHLSGRPALPAGTIAQALGRPVAGEVPYSREWAGWTGEELPPLAGREGILLDLVRVSARDVPGKGE
ncbi:hypothetical protein SY88_02240 [Clostridiales bacterium PH28_bin88]|nr:hypothetical protein SY88_02240 [Clostridiales bacterium PH28_bin88]